MLSLLFWFGVISSGSVLCAAVWGRKYEEILPVTCSTIVLLLFLCGICGILKIGVLLVCGIGLMIYIFSSIYIFKKKRYRVFMKNFFTPAFFVFLCFFIMACFLNIGKMAENWDEFSHWIDITKVMTMFDDFGTHVGSDSAYMSYPPGMTIFQYFLQKLYVWTSHSSFSEWRIYVAYQIFVFSFMVPCFRFNKKKPVLIILSAIGMFISPLLFYGDFYTSTYIDAVLGILSGTGLVTIFLNRNKDLIYSMQILFTCVMLVLLKDAGMLFAILLAIVFVVDIFCSYNDANNKKKFLYILISVLTVVLPKFIWSFHLSVKNAVMKFSSFNVKILWDVIMKNDVSYRKTVVENYKEALILRNVKLGNSGILLNYWALLVLILFLVFLVVWQYGKKDDFYQQKGKIIILGLSAEFVVYIVGLCATYVSNFPEYEAVRLASFERYIHIVYLCGWVVLLFLALQMLYDFFNISFTGGVILGLGVMMIIPVNNVYGYLSRSTVERSITTRKPYTLLSSTILNIVPKGSKIYLISQGTTGFDYWVLRYNIRPNHANSSFTWSIGEAFYEGDIWTRSITPQEWQEELLRDYDYVALYKVNDYFLQNFSCLFKNPEEIKENTVYLLNRETKLLEKCSTTE